MIDENEIEISTRVFGVGIGTFLVTLLSIIFTLVCIATACWNRNQFPIYTSSTILYVSVVTYLLAAKRRSPWANDNDVQESDNMWLVRLCFVSLLALACCASIYALISHHWIPSSNPKPSHYGQYEMYRHSNYGRAQGRPSNTQCYKY